VSAAQRRADLLVAAVPVLLTALTLVLWFDPRLVPATVNGPLDLVLNAAAALVAVAVATLAWIHHRENGDRAALIRASAFLVLAAQNLVFIGISVAGRTTELGLDVSDPGQMPVWSVIVGRAMAALLLVIAGLTALRAFRRGSSLPALLVLAGPTAILLVVSAWMIAVHDALPTLLDGPALAQLSANPTAPLLEEGGVVLILLQAVIGVGFLASALISYRLWRRDGRDAEVYLAIGFILAAFSQVHSAIHPGSYASLVTTGDLLRVVFYGVLLVAVAAEARSDIRQLRAANAELLQLRDAEVERATAEERARLAREIHDGMSQELWYAKLKQSRLAAADDLPPAARDLAQEVAAAIESALSEARQAILALRPAEGASFSQVMTRYVEDFADRFGIPAECEVDGMGESLPTRHQAELLRILQEALTNVHRHADATRVRVRLEATGHGVRLQVADNGRGFSGKEADASRYGLRGMRERAAIIGAVLRIESAPSDGTRVVVEVPMEGAR
jgi:signal transduction histidine kinase